MNQELLKKHLVQFLSDSKKNGEVFKNEYLERTQLVSYYQSFTSEKIATMSEDDVYDYLSKLWAMLIWGNKHYVVDKIIEQNGLDNFRNNLCDLVWGESDIEVRWDSFRQNIKGMGPAMISEILCKTHPDDFMLWSRRVYVGLNYLGVKDLPKYDYQITGKVYKHLCEIAKELASDLANSGFPDKTLLAVDYFIWKQLQVEDNLSKIYTKKLQGKPEVIPPDESEFIHNDIRDKLSDIGSWLGFKTDIEKKVAPGSKVDTIWEATIGNMGRVIYVFEVQTKGSLDSLMLNLLKSLNNPAVQGIVAVSDKKQIELIKKQAQHVKELKDKLKYWDYEDVLNVHESLELVNSKINELGLVPQGF